MVDAPDSDALRADLIVRVSSMPLMNGSGTWSTLKRWCGKYLPYLLRKAAEAELGMVGRCALQIQYDKVVK